MFLLVNSFMTTLWLDPLGSDWLCFSVDSPTFAASLQRDLPHSLPPNSLLKVQACCYTTSTTLSELKQDTQETIKSLSSMFMMNVVVPSCNSTQGVFIQLWLSGHLIVNDNYYISIMNNRQIISHKVSHRNNNGHQDRREYNSNTDNGRRLEGTENTKITNIYI